MKNQFTVFYSWQSDIKKNRYLIENCIKEAIKVIETGHSKEIDLQIDLDRDTKNKTGSINISDTILKKISLCDIFICDVTLINNIPELSQHRLTSNPNVLFELGYAVNLLGWDRVICVNNLKYGNNEQLPFDIRGHRITTFNSVELECKVKLIKVLTDAISSTIHNYEEILSKHNAGKIQSHDKEIFFRINEICSEVKLYDSISSAVDNLFSNGYYYSLWDNLIEFYKSTQNHFLNKDIHEKYLLFLSLLDDFRMICYTNFDLKKRGRSLLEYEEAGIEITEEIKYESLVNDRYSARKEPFPNEKLEEAGKRNQKLQTDLFKKGQFVKEQYKEFVILFKKKQLG